MRFKDRRDAGKQLAEVLEKEKGNKDVIVLGLARGGMVVAAEVAKSLDLPLNVIVVRKIGAPGNEELALGAIGEHGEGIFNQELIQLLDVSSAVLQKEIEKQRKVLEQRLALYRGQSPVPNLIGKRVILVDDGIATGASMRVAIQSVKAAGVKETVLAVPVAAPDSLAELRKEVDEAVCLSSPTFFQGVGAFYQDFDQTSDTAVVKLLKSD